MAANEPEKKMPSTAAKATIRSPEGKKCKKILLTTGKWKPTLGESLSLLCDLHCDVLSVISFLTKGGFAVINPLEGPVCFSSHTRHGLNGVK